MSLNSCGNSKNWKGGLLSSCIFLYFLCIQSSSVGRISATAVSKTAAPDEGSSRTKYAIGFSLATPLTDSIWNAW